MTNLSSGFNAQHSYIAYSSALGDCGPGTFIDSVNSQCTVCPVGTYNGERYQTMCQQCPTGSSTPGTNSTSIDDCTGEYHVEAEVRTVVPSDWFYGGI